MSGDVMLLGEVMHSPKAGCWLALEQKGRLALYKGAYNPVHPKASLSAATLLWELFPGSHTCGEQCCLTLTFDGQTELWSSDIPGSGELLYRAQPASYGRSPAPDPSLQQHNTLPPRRVERRGMPSISLFELVLTRERLCGECGRETKGIAWIMAPRGLVLQEALSHEVLWSSCPLYDRETTLCRVNRLYREAGDLQACTRDLQEFWQRQPATSPIWEYPCSMWEQAYCTLCFQTLCATIAAADPLPFDIPRSPPLVVEAEADPTLKQLAEAAQRKATSPREAASARESALLTEPRHTSSDAEAFYANLHRTDSLSPPRALSEVGGFVTQPSRVITLQVIAVEGDPAALAAELEEALYWLREAIRLLGRWKFRIVACTGLHAEQMRRLATALSAEACWANATAWIASGEEDVMTTWWLVAPGSGVTGSGVGRTLRGAPVVVLPAARVSDRPGQLHVSSQLAGRSMRLGSSEQMVHADRFFSQQLLRFGYSGVERTVPRCPILGGWLLSLCPGLAADEITGRGIPTGESTVGGAQDEVRETEQFLYLIGSGFLNHLDSTPILPYMDM